MKQRLSLILAAALVIGLLAGCGTAAAPADSEAGGVQAAPAGTKTVWKVACMGSETHPSTIGANKFKEEVEARIGDEVEVQIFINGQLGTQPDQQIGGLQNNIIQFCDISISNVTEYTTAFIPLDVPYLFLSREDAMALVDSEIGDLIKARYEEEAGIRLVGFFDYGFRVLTNSKRPVYTPDDMKGLKIRTLSNPIHMEAFNSYGALATTMAYSEVVTGLQQGTIDGQENPTSSVLDAKMHEVQAYMSMTDHVYGFLGFHMSADHYNGMPAAWQTAIDEAAAIAQAHQREYCDAANAQALEDIINSGYTAVNELTEENKLAFRELSMSSWELAKKQCGEDYFNTIAQAAGAM